MLPAQAASLVLGCLLSSPPPTDGGATADNGRAVLGLDEDLRHKLDVAIKSVQVRKSSLAAPANTLAQARRLAKVEAFLNWEAEYRGWYIFARCLRDGQIDSVEKLVLVKKGTQVVGDYDALRPPPARPPVIQRLPYRPFGVPVADPAPRIPPWRR